MVNVLIALINRITHCKFCAPFELDPQLLRVDPWRKTNFTLPNIPGKNCLKYVIDENPAQTIQSASQKRNYMIIVSVH